MSCVKQWHAHKPVCACLRGRGGGKRGGTPCLLNFFYGRAQEAAAVLAVVCVTSSPFLPPSERHPAQGLPFSLRLRGRERETQEAGIARMPLSEGHPAPRPQKGEGGRGTRRHQVHLLRTRLQFDCIARLSNWGNTN